MLSGLHLLLPGIPAKPGLSLSAGVTIFLTTRSIFFMSGWFATGNDFAFLKKGRL